MGEKLKCPIISLSEKAAFDISGLFQSSHMQITSSSKELLVNCEVFGGKQLRVHL